MPSASNDFIQSATSSLVTLDRAIDELWQELQALPLDSPKRSPLILKMRRLEDTLLAVVRT